MTRVVAACLWLCALAVLWLAGMACQARPLRTHLEPFRPYEATIHLVNQSLWPLKQVKVTIRGHRGEVFSNAWGDVRIYPVIQPLAIRSEKAGYAVDERWIPGPGRYRVTLYTLSRTD